ncbi:MAG: alpha/beta fold hydrolase [Catenulispora sp.]|nr:alpha/beta fold hydrolase [Catenulispora sp.]
MLGTAPEEVPTDVAFADLGLDSILRMDVVRRLNDALGSELKAEDLYEHDTADALAAHLAASTGSTDQLAVTANSQLPGTATDQPADSTDQSIDPSTDRTDQLAAIPTDQPTHTPTDHLADQLAERLSALSAAVTGRPLDASATFQDNAFTSFDMLRTIAVLERGFGTLRKTLLFDQPTVAAVAAELLDRFGTQAAARFLADDQAFDAAAQPTPAPAAPDPRQQSTAGPEPLVILKRSLPDQPDLAALVADLDSVHAKEGGLAGRDIAPYALIGTERLGYFNVSIRADLLFAWSYVGTEDYFPILAAELFAYSRAHGLRPNFLSLLPLDSVAGEPITATPFGAVQRLENLADFSLRGGKMSRLRYMVGHFQKAGECRTVEYRSGQDADVDRRVAGMLDRWTENKDMVNPYVTVVRDEIEAGRLAQRHRMFLTYLDDTLANVIIVTRIPSEPGYLMDLEFYPKDGPLGGLEYAIVQIIEALRAEGHTVFSFGASFGVALGSTDNASPEAEQALAELREAGIFGEGTFQFKNKFRPVNVPIYLCQPIGADRTPVSEVILTIADPALTDPPAAPATDLAAAPAEAPTPAPPATPAPAADDSRRALLAAHDWNPLAVPHDRVELDLVTDSWAELDSETIRARGASLATTAADQDPDARPDWLPHPYSLLTGSGRSAEALLCRTFPGRRAAVLHNGLFPTWYGSLIEAGFTPEAIARGGDADHDTSHDSGPDLDRLTARLADTERPVSFICVELSCNAAGGFPVRLETLRAVRQAAEKHGVPLVLDAARIVENAAAEAGGPDLWQSVKDFLSLADAVTMSLSKDFAVPAGGLLALTDAAWASAATQHQLSAGRDLALAGRKQAAAALRDTETVEALVRERMAATAALWQELSDAGLPVPQRPSGHCVLLDTSRLPALTGYREPLMSALAWIFAETGVRGGPHLGDTPELKQMIRLAVPLGLGREPAADAGRRIAAALSTDLNSSSSPSSASSPSPSSAPSPASGPSSAPPDLVAAGDPASPAAMVYRPAADVPDDVADALRTGEIAADNNEAVLREACPNLERHLLPIAGGQVEVFTAGTGPALLLLAPFNIGAGLFARQFAGLTDRFQLVAVHHPGVGATADVTDLSFDGLADLAREALDAVGADGPAHVAGASFGGLAALAFALRHPDHTATLTLIGSSYKVGNRVGEINRLAVVARDDFDAVEAACGPDRFAGRRAELERTLLRCESMDPRTGLRYLDVFATRPDLLGRLPQIAAPTLIVQGLHDTVVPVKAAHALYGAIPDARYVELADAGHFPCLTNAEEVNELLAERA